MGRYIRLRRRLMKLAPDMFDHPIAAQRLERQEEEDRLNRLIMPLLNKVYGTPAKPLDPVPENVRQRDPLDSIPLWKQKRVEQLMQELSVWLAIAQDAMGKMEAQKHPPPMTFSALARLLRHGVALGRIAVGLETNLRIDPHEHLYRRDMNADLERIYGTTAWENETSEEPRADASKQPVLKQESKREEF